MPLRPRATAAIRPTRRARAAVHPTRRARAAVRIHRLLAASLAALALTAALPGSAAANAYTTVSRYYFSHGSVPVCRFSAATLQAALNEVGAFGEQYFADFTDAIQSTLQSQATIRCAHGRPASTLAASSGTAAPPPRGLVPPSSPTAATSAGAPAALVLLGALLVLGVLGGAGITFARWRGWDPEWIARWEHAWAEAGYRLEGVRGRRADRPSRRRSADMVRPRTRGRHPPGTATERLK